MDYWDWNIENYQAKHQNYRVQEWVCLKLLRDLTRNCTLTDDRARKIKI